MSRKVRLTIDPPLSEKARQRLRDVPRGTLRDIETGDLLISATVEYIEAALADPKRNLTLVETVQA